MAIIPTHPGKPKISVSIIYNDISGKKYNLKEEIWVEVAKPNEERQVGTTIFQYHGDYAGTLIKDSALVRSQIGSDAQKEPFYCSKCGEKFNLEKPPKFCPYCSEELLLE
jgi:Zn finger protein HypA/HybF involved in hydrogenase expression